MLNKQNNWHQIIKENQKWLAKEEKKNKDILDFSELRSGWLQAGSYDKETHELTLYIKNKPYYFPEFPLEIWKEMKRKASAGKVLWDTVWFHKRTISVGYHTYSKQLRERIIDRLILNDKKILREKQKKILKEQEKTLNRLKVIKRQQLKWNIAGQRQIVAKEKAILNKQKKRQKAFTQYNINKIINNVKNSKIQQNNSAPKTKISFNNKIKKPKYIKLKKIKIPNIQRSR